MITGEDAHKARIRQLVHGTNAYDVSTARVQQVVVAIYAIYDTAGLQAKMDVLSSKYDGIDNGQDKAITLLQCCCIYGFFAPSRDFEAQSVYISGKGHFKSIISDIKQAGAIDKAMLIAWALSAAEDLAILLTLPADTFDEVVRQMTLSHIDILMNILGGD